MRREDLFERLEPPPGGLAGLRARMSARPSRLRRLAPVAGAVALAAAVLLFLSRGQAPDLVAATRARGGPEAIALGLAPLGGGAASITPEERATTALAEVPSSNPRVAFYWVSSMASPE